jgi:hypothetical protein
MKEAGEREAISGPKLRRFPRDDRKIDTFFWFLWDETDGSPGDIEWEKWADEWPRFIGPSDKYQVSGIAAEIGDLTARDT